MSALRIPLFLCALCVSGLVIALVATDWLNGVGVFLTAAPLLALAARAGRAPNDR
jgi:hypothetical protein